MARFQATEEELIRKDAEAARLGTELASRDAELEKMSRAAEALSS